MNGLIIDGLQIEKQSWKYLFKALGKDKTKENICNKIEITEKEIVATDSYRIHFIPNTFELTPGVYEVTSKNSKTIVLKKIDTKYPDWNVLIGWEKIKTGTEFIGSDDVGNSISLFTVFYELGSMLNYHYFNDIIEDLVKYTPHIVGNDAILFEHSNGNKSIIMPVNPS